MASEALVSQVQGLSDEALLELAGPGMPGVWASSGPLTVGNQLVFLKRLPLTDLEAQRPYSTRNHFKLPTFYSYGVGSAGFGAWRELAGITAMSGAPGFPELIHHRVMPARTFTYKAEFGTADDYVRYWRGNRRIGAYIQARESCSRELWLVLEHVPETVDDWLWSNQDRIDDVICQVFAAIDRLGEADMIHFDAHLGNVVTDGERCRIGDFGLVMAGGFELAARERSFMARHRHYDKATVLGHLGAMLIDELGAWETYRRLPQYIDSLDELPLDCRPEFIDFFRRYRDPICYMLNFWVAMRRPTKAARYDDTFFAQLLTHSLHS